MKLINYITLFLLSLTTLSFASDPSTWQIKQGTVGSEHYEIRLPGNPQVAFERDQMIITVYDGKDAAYLLKVFSPPQVFDEAPNKAFAVLLGVNGQQPREIVDHRVFSINGNKVLDLTALNTETGVTSQYRYIITDKNLWQIKAVYNDAGRQHFEELKNSFKISPQG